MTGAILQLVTNNGAQNRWINEEPQITFFKRVYRRHTPFAREIIPLPFKTKLDFGMSATTSILPLGDLVHRIFLVFDVPRLSARFLHTKTQDISNILCSAQLSDENIRKEIDGWAAIEYEKIMDMIDEALNKYNVEEDSMIKILDVLTNYTDENGTNDLVPTHTSICIDLENEYQKNYKRQESTANNFRDFKRHIMSLCLAQKPEYVLVHEFMKMVYMTEYDVLEEMIISDSGDILYSSIFYDVISHNEILNMFRLNKFKGEDTLESLLVKAHETHLNAYTKSTCNNKKYLRSNLVNPLKTSSYISHKKICGESLYDYGPIFSDIVNTYNALICILGKMAKTVPIITFKSFLLEDSFDIYQKTDPSDFSPRYFATQIDPNFMKRFMIDTNNNQSEHYDLFDEFYPISNINSYVNLYNSTAFDMFNFTRTSMDILYETYRNELFCNTSQLFYDRSPTLTNIYAYLVPTEKYHEDNHITNVFNTNIWYFYFFKYMDNLDEDHFAQYIDLSPNAIFCMKYLFIMLKINIEYYMNETAYMLNDLYATCPSTYPMDSMKNYVPRYYSNIINGLDINNNLFVATFIAHRSNIPTIDEMFEFIQHFIFEIEIDEINKNLEVEIDIDESELKYVRSSLARLYNTIHNHFINAYNRMNFGDNINIKTNEKKLETYVEDFLHKYTVLAQMEFYFIAETLHERQNYFFYQKIFDRDTVESTIGSLGVELVDIINKKFSVEGALYKTLNISRYGGQEYLATDYISRNGVIVETPLMDPLSYPPSKIYGVDPRFYDHAILSYEDLAIDFTSDNLLSTKYHKQIQRETIEYHHLRHRIFYEGDVMPDANIDFYHFSLQKFLSLTQRLLSIYPQRDALIEKYLEMTNMCKHLSFSTRTDLENLVETAKQLYQENYRIYGLEDLIKANISAQFITNNNNYNPIYTLRYLRDNFLSQYHYFVCNKSKIEKLENGIRFESTSKSLSGLLKMDVEISTLLFPEAHPDQIELLASQRELLDDFDKLIFDNITTVLSPEKPPRLTTKDFYDIINLTFTLLQQIYDYAITDENLLDKILKVFSLYHPFLTAKMVLFDKISNYVRTKKFLEETDIEYIIEEAVINGIERESFRLYMLSIQTSYNLLAKNGSYQYQKTYLINNILKSSLDQFFLKIPDKTFKDLIIEKLDLDDAILQRYFGLVDNEYYVFINYFFDFAQRNKLEASTIKNPLFCLDTLPNKIYRGKDLMDYFMDYVWTDAMGIDLPFETIIQPNDYFGRLQQRQTLISRIIDAFQQNIIMIEQYRKEMTKLKSDLCDVLYRNEQAHCAWIKRLAHYLVEEVSIKNDDEIIDLHVSDWFEINSQVAIPHGKKSAYDKMIGDVPILTTFDAKIKDSYTICLPLVFYFNQNVSQSIPLCASTLSKYHLSVKLRNLTEVSFKEQFADFVDADNPLIAIKPSISKPLLMVEYIYLGMEERKIFSTNRLEYLINEVQIDEEVGVDDSNLIPLYLMGTAKKTVDRIESGIKIRFEYYDRKKTKYIEENILEENNRDLIPRSDYIFIQGRDKLGLRKNMMVYKPLDTNKYIHLKRFYYSHHLHHPTKLLSILIKPLLHSDLSMRSTPFNYFYGEKQWDNFGVYSRYDLTDIINIKQAYYQDLKHRLLDIDDKTFGFVALVDSLEKDCQISHEILHKVKRAYITHPTPLFYSPNCAKLRESILLLGINFDIYQEETLEKFLVELSLDPSMDHITFPLSKKDFFDMYQQNHHLYQKYNENLISLFIDEIRSIFDIDLIPYNFSSIIEYFSVVYTKKDEIVMEILKKIKTNKVYCSNPELLNKISTPFSAFKDVLIQILSKDFIATDTLNLLSRLLSEKLNRIIDSEYVHMINYVEYLRVNPEVNPLVSGSISFNTYDIMPEKSSSIMWSEAQAYNSCESSPSTGLNLHAFSLDVFSQQPSGTANLSRIDDMTSRLDLHPMIGDNYPATISSFALNVNFMRYLSGMSGKAWQKN